MATQGALAAEGKKAPRGGPVKIIGLSTSPRKGKTTAAALQVCLEAAKAVGPNVEVELIELAGMGIGVFDPGNPDAGAGDFKKVAAALVDPKVAGIIIGTPVYFGSMSSLCKAFLDRCIAFRKEDFALADKVAGVVAVGGMRNGGQELTIQSVQAAMMAQEMIIVGDGRPTAHRGATLWNSANDDIRGDELGLSTARNVGRRVAEVALRVAGAAG
ncbi:MAG: flavodoxin family protein [Planctomycetes bacterium]|nr:flavodoxin family protein [Planctomycetota bacterium]